MARNKTYVIDECLVWSARIRNKASYYRHHDLNLARATARRLNNGAKVRLSPEELCERGIVQDTEGRWYVIRGMYN